MSYKHPDLDLKIFASPSISPLFNNNPGFSVMTFDLENNVNFQLNYLKLYAYQLAISWTKFDVQKETKIDLSKASEIR